MYTLYGGMYDIRKSDVEIKLADGTEMWHRVSIVVWNGSRDDLLSLDEKLWSPSEYLKSKFMSIFMEESAAGEAAFERGGTFSGKVRPIVPSTQAVDF